MELTVECGECKYKGSLLEGEIDVTIVLPGEVGGETGGKLSTESDSTVIMQVLKYVQIKEWPADSIPCY